MNSESGNDKRAESHSKKDPLQESFNEHPEFDPSGWTIRNDDCSSRVLNQEDPEDNIILAEIARQEVESKEEEDWEKCWEQDDDLGGGNEIVMCEEGLQPSVLSFSPQGQNKSDNTTAEYGKALKTFNYTDVSLDRKADSSEPSPRRVIGKWSPGACQRDEIFPHPPCWSYTAPFPVEKKKFSDPMSSVIGVNNSRFIYGIEHSEIAINFYEVLIEHLATMSFEHNTNEKIQQIWQLREYGFCVNSPDWIATRNRGLCRNRETKFLMITQQVFNRSIFDCCEILGDILGIKYINLISDFNAISNHKLYISKGNRIDNKYAPQHLYSARWSAEAKFLDCIQVTDFSNRVVLAPVLYQMGGTTFFVPALVNKNQFLMGVYPCAPVLLNFTELDKDKQRTVIFCQDMRTAHILDRVVKESVFAQSYTVTSHLSTALDTLRWPFLMGKKIIFIPAPNKEVMSHIGRYHDAVKGFLGEKGSFSVYPGFLLHTRPSQCLNPVDVSDDADERRLIENSFDISHGFDIHHIISALEERTVPFEEYLGIAENLGIIPSQSHECANKPVVLDPLSVPTEIQPDSPSRLSEISLYHFLQPFSSVLIMGMRDIGKTHLALEVCSGILRSNANTPLFRAGYDYKGCIMYVEGNEMSPSMQEKYLKMHGLLDHRRFLFRQVRKGQLANPQFREELKEEIVNSGSQFVFLDNNKSLMGNRFADHTKAEELTEWIDGVCKLGVCIVSILHKDTDSGRGLGLNRATGATSYTHHTQTTIELVGFDEIMTLIERGKIRLPKEIEAELNENTLAVRFLTCKMVDPIRGKMIWHHFSTSGEYHPFYMSDGKGCEVPGWEELFKLTPEDSIKNLTPEARAKFEAAKDGLDNRERIVYSYALSKSGMIQTKDVKELLKLGDNAAREILQNLAAKGLLKENGRGGCGAGYIVV